MIRNVISFFYAKAVRIKNEMFFAKFSVIYLDHHQGRMTGERKGRTKEGRRGRRGGKKPEIQKRTHG